MSQRGIAELFPDPDEEIAFNADVIGAMAKRSDGRLKLMQRVFNADGLIVAFKGVERAVFVAASLVAKENPSVSLMLFGEVSNPMGASAFRR